MQSTTFSQPLERPSAIPLSLSPSQKTIAISNTTRVYSTKPCPCSSVHNLLIRFAISEPPAFNSRRVESSKATPMPSHARLQKARRLEKVPQNRISTSTSMPRFENDEAELGGLARDHVLNKNLRQKRKVALRSAISQPKAVNCRLIVSLTCGRADWTVCRYECAGQSMSPKLRRERQ